MDPTLHERIYDETKVDVVWKKLENFFARKTSGNNEKTCQLEVQGWEQHG